MKTTRLTLYLMHSKVKKFEDALDRTKPMQKVDTNPSTGVDCNFYYAIPKHTVPAWSQFVQPLLSKPLEGLSASSTAALLLVRSEERIFALTFGYGRSLLNLAKIEYQFGLRVALNRIDPRQIRSLDTKTFEDLVVSTHTQASKSAELPTFGVDITRDILRSVTGEPRTDEFARRITGSDPLVMAAKTSALELPAVCTELLSAFHDNTYKQDFGWIDQLSLVRKKESIEKLDACLVEQLRNGQCATTHLAIPETIGWENIDGFRIRGTGQYVYEDLDIEEYLTRLDDKCKSIAIQKLKTREVSVRYATSAQFEKISSLYRCLVSEQRINGKLHVLIEGRWFSISSSLVGEVDAFVNRLPEMKELLPPALVSEHEKVYNARAAEMSNAKLLNLDAQVKRPGGASSGIEFCDILSDQGDLIHIKRKSRSSTLSHLFAQGSVSASTFINDGEFRDQIRELIKSRVADEVREKWLSLVPPAGSAVDRARYRVNYAVITSASDQGRDWLPFFSKLNLMQHARSLKTMGMEVAVSHIPVES